MYEENVKKTRKRKSVLPEEMKEKKQRKKRQTKKENVEVEEAEFTEMKEDPIVEEETSEKKTNNEIAIEKEIEFEEESDSKEVDNEETSKEESKSENTMEEESEEPIVETEEDFSKDEFSFSEFESEFDEEDREFMKKIMELADNSIDTTDDELLDKEEELEETEKESLKSILLTYFDNFKSHLRAFRESDEKQFLGIKADWVSIIVKMLLFLIVAFLVIFVVTKLRTKGNSFEENMEKMKDVSYTYYKVASHRPVLLNEEVLMTLGDMEKGSLLPELKDKKNNVCSKEYSYVSLVNRGDDNYELKVYLSCGGESKSAFYNVSYSNSSDNNSNSNDNEIINKEEQSGKIILYELERDVVEKNTYSCPNGYDLSGRYCIKMGETVTVSATPKYRVIPEVNRPAIQKSSGSEYEYVDAIVVKNESTMTCPNGYTLNNGKCEKEGTVKYSVRTNYTCPNGGTPSGKNCLFTTNANYSNQSYYCKNGVSRNGRCYVSTKYDVRCIYGSRDSSRNACYTTYSSYTTLSDWMFDSIVTYSESRVLNDTDKVRYEVLEYYNGKARYRKYVRVNKKTCDEGDTLSGSTCRHYDIAYEERYCSNSKYSLSSDKSECFYYEDMSVKQTSGSYSCPDGYQSRGTGSNMSCYKYENATKVEEKTPYCTAKYSLTSDGRCVSVVDGAVKNEEAYTCPDGYTKRGSGSSTMCYKKVQKESYIYCSSSEATLVGDRCIIPERTDFIGYSCPSGYRISGNECIKTNSKETILATKNEGTFTSRETIWSKTKDLDGWTFTGNTKEA